MKGYNKQLKNFIEYVFKKYARDENVKQFRVVYDTKIQEQENRKAIKRMTNLMTKSVKITLDTAIFCNKLVRNEIIKGEILSNYTDKFMEKLRFAHEELCDILGTNYE